MVFPDFQTLMLPVLTYLSDQKEHTSSDILRHIEQAYQFTEEQKKQKLQSGQTVIYNRVLWAISYLKRASLLETIRRGCYKVTLEGVVLLANPPEKVTIKFLKHHYNLNHKNSKKLETDVIDNDLTFEMDKSPEEAIDILHESIQKKLSIELLDLVFHNSPSFFEKLVVDLVVKMGYGGNRKEAGEAVGKSNDEGIDGVINEDRLGLDTIYIQAKRWKRDNTVGRPEIQKFVGALAGKHASKGIFITTSSFSTEARNYIKNIQQKVILIDGLELAQYMVEYNIGVSVENAYVIKKIDTDYFEEL